MKSKLQLLLLVIFFLSACNVGVKKDLLSGLKVTNNGLSFEEAFLQVDDAKFNSNEFPSGKMVYLFATGVSGFAIKDGLVNLGGSVVITDESGNKVMDHPDLFEAYTTTGVSAEDASTINFYVPMNEMFSPGKKYLWKTRIWDKNGEGAIEAEVEFTVK
jgi:hypothetical protein